MPYVSRIGSVVRAATITAIVLSAGQAQPATTALPRGIVRIENGAVRLEFDPATGRMSFSDLRTQAVWRQAGLPDILPQVKSVHCQPGGRALQAELDTVAGMVELAVEVQDPAEVLVRLIPRGAPRADPLNYPLPAAPSPQAELVLPADEGVLLPVTAVDFPHVLGHYQYRSDDYSMPWFGLVEGGGGLMALVETADDLTLNVAKVSAAAADGAVPVEVLSPGVVWLPSRGALRYERRVRFCLFDRGGYVAMAKRYRKYLVDGGRFRTLAEKARELPEVSKLLGAIDIHDRSGSPERDEGPDVLDWMIHNGIRRAVYYGPLDRQRNEKALAAGYLTARYDIYTDIGPPELVAVSKRHPYASLLGGYPDEAVVLRDGSLKASFAYPVNVRGGTLGAGEQLQTIRSVQRCSSEKLAWLKKDVPEQSSRFAFHARFLDMETATAPSECYSPKHPLTRGEDRQVRVELFDYLRGHGQIAASEGGADWPAYALHYQEGSLTLKRFATFKGVYVGTAPFDLSDEYIAVQFNMARRVPLHKLVYHDSLLMTWRWNHTPNRWRRGAEYWDQWDLLHILYGGMPIFVLDRRNVAKNGPRILQSYRTICGVLEKTGGSEMLAHRFLTPDRQVQQTEFANGWRVTVNFDSEKRYRTSEGTTIEPKGFAVSKD